MGDAAFFGGCVGPRMESWNNEVKVVPLHPQINSGQE